MRFQEYLRNQQRGVRREGGMTGAAQGQWGQPRLQRGQRLLDFGAVAAVALRRKLFAACFWLRGTGERGERGGVVVSGRVDHASPSSPFLSTLSVLIFKIFWHFNYLKSVL